MRKQNNFHIEGSCERKLDAFLFIFDFFFPNTVLLIICDISAIVLGCPGDAIQTTSTLSRLNLKTQLFLSGQAFRPH